MELLVDRQITGAEKIFSHLGAVRLFDGGDIKSTDLGQAEALIVRSVTKVNAKLLSSSVVRVVGSATSGTDHVDLPFLTKRGIQFFDAKGCNSRAVAEYVVCCIFDYCHAASMRAGDLTVGIIGFGHVGQALGAMLDDLSVKFVVYDPFRKDMDKELRVASLDEIFDCNVITLHVPFTMEGEFPTAGMVSRKYLARLKPKQLIINSARGGILDERALVDQIQRTKNLYSIIDCWVNEPRIDADLSAVVFRGTPHIAGHTREARHRAAEILYARISEWLKLSVPAFSSMRNSCPSQKVMFKEGLAIHELLLSICPLDLHTDKIKTLSQMTVTEKRTHFDGIRQKHGLRSEFSAYSIGSSKLDNATIRILKILGFE